MQHTVWCLIVLRVGVQSQGPVVEAFGLDFGWSQDLASSRRNVQWYLEKFRRFTLKTVFYYMVNSFKILETNNDEKTFL
jgi:hypothetical protein